MMCLDSEDAKETQGYSVSTDIVPFLSQSAEHLPGSHGHQFYKQGFGLTQLEFKATTYSSRNLTLYHYTIASVIATD